MLFDYDTFTSRGVGGNVDIGTNCSPVGSASLSSGTWTVIGGGSDIFGTADTFHFVNQSMSGNQTLSCQVVSQTNTSSSAKSGIMFRNSLANNDVFFHLFMEQTSAHVEYRTTSGGSASASSTLSSLTLPYYLQVVRSGNVFTANTSPDGSTWTQLAQITLSNANTAMYVGLTTCSHNNGTACTSVFNTLSQTITPVTNTWSNASDGTAWSIKQGTPLLGVSSIAGLIYSSGGDATMQLGSQTATDMDVSTQIILANASDKVGVLARLSGTGSTETWYGLRWYGGNLNLEKNVAGTISAIATAATTTMTIGTSYTFRLRCTGTKIQGKFWQTSSTEPTTWNLTASNDSSITSGGYGIFANSTTAVPNTFGNTAGFAVQDGFVTRSSANLVYNNATWRFSGGNCYWMGLQEVPNVSYPTNNQIEDALTTLVEMGATAVRVHTLGISVGTSLSVEPTHNAYNSAAFASMDYAIKRIGDYGLKAIIPLVDNWAYYHGGKHHYTDFLSKANNPTVFYTDATTISDFEAYINQILTRVNSLTGVPYYADSTVLCWETGNELSYWPANSPSYPDTSWTTAIAAYIKTLDTNHLIMAGTGSPNSADYSITNIDICTAHFYPLNVSNLTSYASAVNTGGKCFIVGEYDWTGQYGGDSLSSFLSTIEGNNTIDGDLFWGLYGHADTGTGGFNEYAHDYTLYYPGENPTRAAIVQQLRTHMYKMQGINTPPAAGTPGAPVLLAVNKLGGPYVQPVWRGVPIAASYNVEKSTTGPSGTFNTVASGVTDWQLPLIISGIPGGQSWWRVKAANTAGSFGSYSNVIQISLP